MLLHSPHDFFLVSPDKVFLAEATQHITKASSRHAFLFSPKSTLSLLIRIFFFEGIDGPHRPYHLFAP